MEEATKQECMNKRAADFRKAFSEMMQQFNIQHAVLSVGFGSETDENVFAEMAGLMVDSRVVPKEQVSSRLAASIVSIVETFQGEGLADLRHEYHAPIGRA